MLHSKARRDCGPSRLLQKALRSASPQAHHYFFSSRTTPAAHEGASPTFSEYG